MGSGLAPPLNAIIQVKIELVETTAPDHPSVW